MEKSEKKQSIKAKDAASSQSLGQQVINDKGKVISGDPDYPNLR